MAEGGFDAVSSIGLTEHIGVANYPAYFRFLRGRLRPGGRLLNHCITRPDNVQTPRVRGGFIDRYVFPDGELTGSGRIISTIQDVGGLEVRHEENLREHYAKTCAAWCANLVEHWDECVRRGRRGHREGVGPVPRGLAGGLRAQLDPAAPGARREAAQGRTRGLPAASGLGLRPDSAAGPGPVALVGSGEYLPALEFLERALITGRPARYAQLATAAAPEGPASLARWHGLGADAAARLDVEQVVVPVSNRDDADDPGNAELVAGAGLIYLSGGSPGYLTETLRATRVWAAIVDAWRNGAALAGCSAGAMALSAGFPGFRRPWRSSAGLGLVPVVRVIPHFDRFGASPAGRRAARPRAHGRRRPAGRASTRRPRWSAALTPPGWQTDPAGPGNAWQVLGRQSAWLLGPGGRRRVAAGESVVLPVPAAA